PTTFRTKYKGISDGVVDQIVLLGTFGGYGKQAAILEAFRTLGPPVIDGDRGEFVIVQSGAYQLLVIQRKSQRLYKMQHGAGIGAEPDDVAGVRRNFRLIQNDVEHG